MKIYILINGRTRAVCGAFSSYEVARHYAIVHNIDSWHTVERQLDTAPIQYA